MTYTHCLLFKDTPYGCTVQMATVLDSMVTPYDYIIRYTDATSMINDWQHLYNQYATDEGQFNYTAYQLYDVLMGAY